MITSRAGASLLAIEAMKMEHSIHAPTDGVVTELPIAIGAQVDSGSVLAVLEEEESDDRTGSLRGDRTASPG